VPGLRYHEGVGELLTYEPAASFRRTRVKRLFSGAMLAVLVAWVLGTLFAPIPVWFRLVLLAIAAFGLFEAARDFFRCTGLWEIRIADDRVYLREPDDPEGRTVELRDVEHVMVGDYSEKGKKVFLLLYDGRCWEVPHELVFPVRPLVRAIRSAAPHVKEVTNKQMPERDPLHVPTSWELRQWRRRERDRKRAAAAAAAAAVPTQPTSEPDLIQPE
jgi:hypothetical protein